MKARIKETGHIVEVEDFFDDGTALVNGCYIKVSKLSFIDCIDYEQRRYEIAKDVLAAFMSNSNVSVFGYSIEKQAKDAVEYADALIEELKKTK